MILGIDPGLSGGWALLTDDGDYVAAEDLPIIRDLSTAWIDGTEFTAQVWGRMPAGKSIRATIERVSARPGQGVSSMFAFGAAFGSILSAVQSLPASIELVTPNVWKRELGVAKDKACSLDRARLLFPQASLKRNRDDGRAEALLIAYWAWKRRRP